MSYPVTTEQFTITPATYARVALSHLAGRWWWLIVLPPAIFLIMSMSDKAYIFAAMIWIFMLLPPAVMMAYYSYLLNPEAATLSKSHKVAIAHDGSITITFPPSEDEDVITPHPITMRNEDLDDLQDKNNMIILTFRKSNLKFLIIPVDSFPTGTLPLAIAALTKQ